MTWTDEMVMGFDLETCSADPETARIVQLAFSGSAKGEEPSTVTCLVNPGEPIPEQATAIHGITDAMVADAIPHREAVDRVVAVLIDLGTQGVPLVGMNLAFDLTIMDRQWEALVGLDTLGKYLPPVVDVLVLDKHFDQFRKGSRKLTALAEHYGVAVHDAHDAGADAEMSVAILQVMAGRYPMIAAMDPKDLHDAQREWRLEQVVSFSNFLRDKGEPELDVEVEGKWPIHGRRGASAEVA